jgi:hypothetical protein
MNDPAVGRLKRLDEFTLQELEAVRLMLRGESVIDWHRLQLVDADEARRFLVTQEFRPDEPADRSRLESIKNESIAYLRRHFEFPIPKPVERASVEDLLLLASGFPITEFVGGRKNKDSLYTKLLSKADTTAAAIYDKLRFRIVTRSADDILPVLLYLSERLLPFNYVVPRESINTIFHFRSYCETNPHLKALLRALQSGADDELTVGDNTFSAENYRVIHFVVDLPVRLPPEIMEMAPPAAWALGPIIFVLVEFQLIDRETEAANELGDASHSKYKERQKLAVMRRLKLGSARGR